MGKAAFLNPLINSTNLNGFMGNLLTAGNTVYRVPDDNSMFTGLTPKAAFDTATKLRDWIIANIPTATVGNPLMIGSHSRGGQIALLCLRMYGAEIQAALTAAGKTAQVIQFYLAGNPEMPYTGSCYLFPTQDKPIYPGATDTHVGNCPIPIEQHGGWGVGYGINITPGAVPWYITFVSNEFDGWSHAPAGYASAPSMDERITIFGLDIRPPWFSPGNVFSRMRNKEGFHSGNDHYRQNPLDPDVPKATYSIPGTNMKCVWITKYPMPYAYNERMIRFKARAKDLKYRPLWKAAYTNMPAGVTIPNPDYNTLPSWIPFKG